MRMAELVNLSYFLFFTVLALMWRLPPCSRTKAILTGIAGLGITGTAVTADRWLTPDSARIFRDWIPAPLMALAYWQSGWFFQKVNPALQAVFDNSDRKILQLLRVDLAVYARTWAGALLELAYVFCYPVVPLGLGALYIVGLRNVADRYWTVVLLSAYPCYVLLPFLQLLPPRLVEGIAASAKPKLNVRRFNLWLVRHVTHEANTFPSGHVAASAAIALMLLRFTPAVGIIFVLIALGIAAGCIVGRYHYVIDVAAALALAGMVFAVVGL